MTKTIVVTGGAGFIGSNLCDRLIKEGHRVVCVDNLYTGNKSNIEHLLPNSKFDFVECDVIHTSYYIKSISIDEIYNLACPASPPHYQKNPIFTTKTSVLGALNVLQLASENKAKILQASTSEVYGNPLVHPQIETYLGNVNPNGIRSCYDEGKRCAESLFMDYNRYYGTRTKIIRIFNTYGPNMDPCDGRVVSNFIIQALKGKNITIYGDGSQTRSFQYIDDLIDGMIKVMATNDKFTGPVNLGNPEEFTVEELAHKVIELTNSKSKIIYKPLPEDDPIKRKPDITKAIDSIDWKPRIGLEEGLKKTIDYFKKII